MDTSKFFELMSAQNIAQYVEKDPTLADAYLGEALFPARKVDGLTLTYIKDTQGLPIALKPSQFDTKAPIRDRMAVEAMEHDMPFFREGMILGERERQELMNAMQRSPQAYLPILERLYNDRANLVAGAQAQAERMRMQLLSTGEINVVANGEHLSYNFKLDDDQIVNLEDEDVWTNPDADILGFIEQAKETIAEKTGAELSRMLMTSKTFKLLRQNNQVKALLNPLAVNAAIVLDGNVKQAIEQATGLTVITYDKRFRDEQGKTQKFFPDGVVALLPSGNLGMTNYGTTPEEYDLLNTTNHRADVEIVNTGVAITTYKQEHPVNSKTLVSQITMPSFEQASSVFIATVTKEEVTP